MAQIRTKEILAQQLKEGIRAVAEQSDRSIEQVDNDFAACLGVEARTLKSWKNRSSIPDNLDDEKLLGLVWLILERGNSGLVWLVKLLGATSLPIVEPPTTIWVRSCLRGARIRRDEAGLFNHPDYEQIEAILNRLFTHEAVSSTQISTPIPLEPPDGAVAYHSPFYVRRASDATTLKAIQTPGVTLVIKAPRQLGKTSLLIRTIQTAQEKGKRTTFLDFQRFEQTTLRDSETFLRQFCGWLSRLLGLENRVEEFWSEPLGNIQRCTAYLEEYLLPAVNAPLVLAMDEVDAIFDTGFRSDFFGMLRSWHNARQMYPVWKQLDLVLVTSTQPYQLVENLNLSPFNVGITVELEDFNFSEVEDLNRRHNQPFSPVELVRLTSLVGGQPYLIRQALYLVKSGQIMVSDLFAHALDDYGAFGGHLRYFYQRLHRNPALVAGMREILATSSCSDETIFWRLQGAGLVKRSGKIITPRCQLYADYFKERLG